MQDLSRTTVMFHGAPHNAVSSIVRYGFIVPGQDPGNSGVKPRLRVWGSTKLTSRISKLALEEHILSTVVEGGCDYKPYYESRPYSRLSFLRPTRSVI